MWINCKDRLPNPDETVLVWDSGSIEKGFLRHPIERKKYHIHVNKEKLVWYCENYDYDGCPGEAFGVTHWMPLLEGPNGEKL